MFIQSTVAHSDIAGTIIDITIIAVAPQDNIISAGNYDIQIFASNFTFFLLALRKRGDNDQNHVIFISGSML